MHNTKLPDIDFRHLRAFLALAQIGNFSATARTLAVSQSAVSRQILALEAALGVRLFERLGRRAVLTFAGNALRARVERLMREAESLPPLIADLSEGVRGELRIGAATTPANTIVPALLIAYRRRYPEVRLALEINNSERLLESLQRGGIDVAFVAAKTVPPAILLLAETPDELVLIASPSNPLTHRPLKPEDLCDCEFIERLSGAHTRTVVEQWFQSQRVQPRSRMEVG